MLDRGRRGIAGALRREGHHRFVFMLFLGAIFSTSAACSAR